MPELPEVETVKRQLEPDLKGKRLTSCHLFWEKTLEAYDSDTLIMRIKGQKITGILRRGKYLILELEQGYLVYHLRMTGRMYCCKGPEGLDTWVRFSLGLDDSSFLCFSDSRKFGRVFFSSDLSRLEDKLGPEPLNLKPSDWVKLFENHPTGLKAFLLNQKKIAGIGNIYADESLFQAGLHPLMPARSLSALQAKRLGKAIGDCLKKAIEHEGASISWYRKPDGSEGESQKHFMVYGKAGQPCPTCSHPMEKIKVTQRSTVFCPNCQPFDPF